MTGAVAVVDVVIRLRVEDGRVYTVTARHEATDESTEDFVDGIEFLYTDGNFACDCNLSKMLNEQHGLGRNEGSCEQRLVMESCLINGRECL